MMKIIFLSALLLLLALPQESVCHDSAWLEELLHEMANKVEKASESSGKHSPILIIPGLMGSKLYVEDDGYGRPNLITRKKKCQTSETLLWIKPERLLHQWGKCVQRELELEPTDSYGSKEGVEISIKDFGKTKCCENIYKEFGIQGLVNYFVGHGYTKDEDIRAAPYDWRLAPDELDKQHDYFAKVRDEIVDMYNDYGKVTIIALSLGGPTSHYFLTQYKGIDQDWKNKHIHHYIPVVGGWNGGTMVVEALLAGPHTLASRAGVLKSLVLKYLSPIVKTFESLYWISPSESIWGDRVIVTTKTKTYKASEQEQMYTDAGMESSAKQQSDAKMISPNYPPPNVPTFCAYAVGTETMEQLHFDKDFDGESPLSGNRYNVLFGDGDGIVNTHVAEVCLPWKSMMPRYAFSSLKCNGTHMKPCANEDNPKMLGEKILEIVNDF